MNWKNEINPATGKNFASIQEYVEHLENREKQLTAELAEKNNRTVTFKVAEESGAVSIYGIQNQRPVTLYSQQIERLIESFNGAVMSETSPIGIFLAKAKPFLSLKDDSDAVAATKKALRVADATGICAHPSEKNKKQAA